MKEIIKALRPVKNRIRRNRFLRGAAAGLAAGLAAAAVLQAVAFFAPVPDRGLWAAIAAAAVTLLAAAVNALRSVKDTDAAKAADACGLKERTITALEGGNEPIRQLQRRDACEALKNLDVKQIRPGSVKKYLFAALGCGIAAVVLHLLEDAPALRALGCAALLCCLTLIPSPTDGEAAAHKALTQTIRKGQEAIDRAAEEDAEKLPDEKKSELRKITADLRRELEGSRDAADALVALDRAEQRLEKMRQETAGELSAEGSGAAGESGTDGTGKNSGAEGQASGDAASKAEAGQQGAASADSTAGSQMKTTQAVSALKSAVNPSLQSATGSQGAQSSQGSQSSQGAQGATGATGNSGSMNGQNGQSGSGASGNNSGMSSGGAGEGSTNEEQKGSGGSSGQIMKGNRDSRYKESQYETIYDPERIGKSRQDVMTEQNRLGDEDSQQIETGPGRGNLQGDVPWGEALQDYAETEAQAADRENLTVQERQWVDEYYRLLTEQQ